MGLSTGFNSPIFTRGRAKLMVRTTAPISPFYCAKTCSTLDRTADSCALARRVRLGIGRPFGFLRWMRETRPRASSIASFFAER